MGVLSKGTEHIVRKLVYKSSTMILSLIITLIGISPSNSDKVVVEYLGEDYLVTGGCPATDPTVLRWHKFCSFLHGNNTLCVTQRFGKNILTVPRFSNVCDALCHTDLSETMSTCPKEEGSRGKPFSPNALSLNTAPSSSRVIVSYENSEYLVRSGCPVDDNLVQRKMFAIFMNYTQHISKSR